jgi:hypothetical protein
MKKPLLILFFCLLIFSAEGQALRWGLNIAPGISFRIPQNHHLSDFAQSIQLGEAPMYVFDFGIDIRQQISPRLYFGTGIFYSQKGFSNTHVAAVYDDPALSRRYLIDFVQNYLEIPFFLTYDLYSSDKLQFYPLAGITNSLVLSSKNSPAATGGEVSDETLDKLRETYLKNELLHNVGVLGGLGVMTSVDPKTSIGIEAIGKVMLSPLIDHFSDSRRHLYSVNLNFRFVRKIR